MMGAASDGTDLAARLRRLEDRWELSDLIARYGRAVDDRDPDAIRELFAAEAVFDTVAGVYRGREALVEFYLERLSGFGASFHVPHTQTVEFLSDDRAHGIVTAHAEMAAGDEAFWVALRYHDDYVREDGRWCFELRRVEQLYGMPLRELMTDMGSDERLRWPGMPRGTAPLPPPGALRPRDQRGV